MRQCTVVLLVLTCLPLIGQAEGYRLVDLGPGQAYGINERGDVVGVMPITYDTFVCHPDGSRTILTQKSQYVADINDAGSVVGFTPQYTNGGSRAWALGNGLLRYITETGYSRPYKINNRDEVVGEFEEGWYQRAFVWSSTNGLTAIPAPEFATSRACSLNDHGEVVGSITDSETPRMFVWRAASGVEYLPANYGVAYDINNNGQIIAYGSCAAGYGALLYQNGSFQALPRLGYTYFYPVRINNAGVVIGNTSTYIPVVWDPVEGLRRVADLIDPATNPGITLRQVTDINDNGDISAYGWDAMGTYHALLLKGANPDVTPPVISGLLADPAELWPPQNDLRTVTLSYAVTDDRDPAPVARIASVTCNQAVEEGDMVILSDHEVDLRAVRVAGSPKKNGTEGRVYTITVEASDASGNTATASVAVTVPRNPTNPGNGKGKGVTGAAAAVAGNGTISITAQVSGPCNLQATIMNMAGVRIRALAPVSTEETSVTMLWDGRNERGSRAPAGRYLVKVDSFSEDGTRASLIVPLQLQR